MARKVTQSRSDLRKERYRHLRSLGFSSAHARKFRDQSHTHITEFVDDERERIVTKKSNVRTPQEKVILREIRSSRRRTNQVEVAPRLKPISERAEDFSRWTADGNFPSYAEKFIAEQNAQKGLSPVDSYGYRRFYWAYVENIPVDEIGELADRGDSGELS